MSSLTTESLKPVINRLLKEAWGVREGEKILIISDYPTSEDFEQKTLSVLESMMERNILARRIRDAIDELVTNPIDVYFMKPTFRHYKNPEEATTNMVKIKHTLSPNKQNKRIYKKMAQIYLDQILNVVGKKRITGKIKI